jgi:hypothetical protein
VEANLMGTGQTIHGQVVDPAGNPVSEAAVYVAAAPVAMPDIALLTDEQGNFTLGAPAAVQYAIGARAEPWAPVQVAVEVNLAQAASVKIQFTHKE